MIEHEASAGNQIPADNSLLSICALLRGLDRDLLSVVVECGEDEIAALLSSPSVEPAPAGGYRVRADARADLLAQLRAERPSDELTWHTRFFEHFLREMGETELKARRAAVEAECFHHLGELFHLLAARREWQTLSAQIVAARAGQPQYSQHLHQLSFYEGYVALRTQSYERAEIMMIKLIEQPDLDNILRIQVLNALGQIFWLRGRYDRALGYYQRVYALAQQSSSIFYQAVSQANMGIIYHEMNQYEQAFELTSSSLDMFRELGDHNSEAHALYNIGNYATYLGRWQVAQHRFEEALRLYNSLNLRSGMGDLYWGRAFLHLLLGNETLSEESYLQALDFSQSPEYGEPVLTRDSWFYLGLLYQIQERWDEAVNAYDKAIYLAVQLRHPHYTSLIDYRRGNVFERQGRLDAAMEAYRAAIAGIDQLRGHTQAEEIKIGLLGTVQQVYESTVRLCLARGQVAEAFEYVERARSRALLDMLAGKRQRQANGNGGEPDGAADELRDELAAPIVTLSDVQAALPPDALLVEFYTTGVLPRGEALINKIPRENARLREHLALPPQVIGFAVTRDRVEVFYPTVEPNTLRPQPGDPGPGRRLLRDRLLVHLHDQLIAPLADELTGKTQLYIIPHGPLHYVPFMALRSATGEHLLRQNGPAIALAPSATVLLRSCLAQRPGRGAGAVALGYNDEGDDCLRYAEIEAGHVAALAGGAAWIGPEPKSAPLAEQGGRARWLHIAGHAVFDPHDPLGSYIQLGRGEQLSARQIMGSLELHADLVTLSACMSGVTHVVPGDELLGLQRAFLYAGAPAVVCTLWEAADMVALVVMDRFYAAIRRGQPPGAALRDAQVAVRAMTGRDLLATIERWHAEDPDFVAALGELPEVPTTALDAPIYADPFYWAPFMLIGRPN
jgi:CHAT domain-containing protein/tetratricopeptide (TPR) repeat protein